MVTQTAYGLSRQVSIPYDNAHHRSGLLVFARHVESGPVTFSLVIEDQEVALLWETAPTT